MDKASENREKQVRNLIELNDELENYFRNTVIPQLFVDADFILRKFTPPAMKHFNLSSADVGKRINDIIHNIRYPTIIENITEVIESKEDFEKEIQTTDKKWYQMNILPYIIWKENKPNGVIITFVDITGRIEVLKSFERLNLKYENTFYSISHDLKGPLSNIEGLVKLLKDIPDLKENANSIVNVLGLSVGNLRKTIEELTTEISTSNDTTTFTEEAEDVNFEKVFEDVQLALKDKILDTEAKITTEFNVSEIRFSKKNIRSVIYNLMSNAIKYKAPDRAPEIFIKTEKVNNIVLLSIRDNGRGIAKDQLEMIFFRYTRISNDIEGTGVGLFIAKRMIEDGGGTIKVESSLGEGTTFKVYLKD